ncbi:MAG: radical SAM protein [Candidatus Cloacimonetes bacterium]|nr:radical SAM protein [Candidatus Cloacimonadota bacterium]
MKLSEVFYSMQGESTYSGLPCFFIRTAGCNLKCSYCDTRYARKVKTEIPPIEVMRLIEFFDTNVLIELTGGEPLLQEDIYDLFPLIHQQGNTILLETNGSISLKDVPDYVCKIVDIKTPGSGYGKSFLYDNLKYINPSQDNIKIVLTSLKDYEWMKEVLAANNLYGRHVLVSTVFDERLQVKIIDRILKDGLDVRFQIQMHKYIGFK